MSNTNILICPICKAGLHDQHANKNSDRIVCNGCDVSYPVIGGIPYLMKTYAEPLSSFHQSTTHIVKSLEETEALAKDLAPKLKYKIILINGDLAAGKTTFVSAVSRCYGDVYPSSPTFSICHQYLADHNIYHYDLYNIRSVDELQMFDFFDVLNYNESTVFIEWSKLFPVEQYIYPKHLDRLVKLVITSLPDVGDLGDANNDNVSNTNDSIVSDSQVQDNNENKNTDDEKDQNNNSQRSIKLTLPKSQI